MAVEKGIISLTLPRNPDIPQTFSGLKALSVSAEFNTKLKEVYVGTFGKPTYWADGQALTLVKNTGKVHKGTINIQKAGIKKTISVASMLSDFTGAIAKFKVLGYKAVITRQ